LPVDKRQANFLSVILETALADALYLNWAIPVSRLPAPPVGLRYDRSERGGESLAFFSLVLFRQVGLHLQGASWLALSYPQVNARLYVRDAANTASVLLLRQLVPGWAVPVGRLVGGPPVSAAVCDFPDGLPRTPPPEAGNGGRLEQDERTWRWGFSAGARFTVAALVGGVHAPGSEVAGQSWERDVAFFRDRTRAFWLRSGTLRRSDSEHPASTFIPVSARIERADWLETFLSFAPSQGWSELHSAFLVPRVQVVFAFGSARDLPVAAPVAAAG
jgi:hypothetical protein